MSDDRAVVLVVEDERDILDVIEYNLQREGFRVEHALDGAAALASAAHTNPDLVVLDVMLPRVDGIEVCRQLRAREATSQTPILMLTAKGDESDIVLGLGVGADDYVVKPFSPRELVARVHALLRRNARRPQASSSSSDERIESGDLIIDLGRHEVVIAGEPVRFTRTELRLLFALASRSGRALSRDQLVSAVMGDDAWITDRTIDVHIRSIRKKLRHCAEMIETIRGVGYRFRDTPVVNR